MTATRPSPSRLPLQPRELIGAGLCAKHPHPEWWTSSVSLERRAAAAVCGYCPVAEACRTWALGLPLTDNAVYGGVDAKGRRRLRRAAQEAIPAPAEGGELPAA